MKDELFEQFLRDILRRHHDAWVVELLGPHAALAGITPERVQELLELEELDPEALGGLTVPGFRRPLDLFLVMRLLSRAVDRLAVTDVDGAYRDWTLDEWLPELETEYSRALVDDGPPPPPEHGITVTLPAGPEPPGAFPREGGVALEAPPWLAPAEQDAYRQAVERAAEYARGLGNAEAEDLEEALAESWEGEDILREVEPSKRAETIAVIREETAAAGAGHRDPRVLARDIAERTGNWAHNWQRIAETELQGSYNDGRVLDAVRAYGDEAQVAVVPETTACSDCRRLALGDDGAPIVWPVAELLAHGTNVGIRDKSAWQATIWPIHPRCHCDRVVVPPGMRVLPDGRLRRRVKE